MKRRLFTAGLVFASVACAFAQDEKVLNDKDDVAFAQALVDAGYPDLAQRLLSLVEKKGTNAADAKAAIQKIKLDVAQDDARKNEDLVKRKDALVAVLRAKEKFVDDFKGTTAAEDVRNALPDLYAVIGETITAAIRKSKDDKQIESLRSEGDALFVQAEQAIQKRVDDLAATHPLPDSDDYPRFRAARYNHAKTLYYHAMMFSPGSGKRVELCDAAVKEFGEFDLDFNGDDAPILIYYAYVDVGLCLKEMSKFDEATASLDLTIKLRESYGDKVKGVWPIPGGARDVMDIVCYALLQKALILKDQKKLDKVVDLGKDWFTSTPKEFQFDPSSSMLLAQQLAEAQLAVGDAKGAEATAKRMIEADDAGIGGQWGRDLLERTGGAGVSYTEKLKDAGAKIGSNDKNDNERGMTICRQVLSDVAGGPDEQEGSCELLLLIAYVYEKRGWYDEAAFTYEWAVTHYPKSKGASDALKRAIVCYGAANGSLRRKYYKDKVDALNAQLMRDFPSEAGDALMTKADGLARDAKYQDAIDIWNKIESSSPNYTKSRLLIGIAWFNQGQTLAGDKDKPKPDDAKASWAKAEAAFKATIDAIQHHPDTMDAKILSAYEEQMYLARLSLAKLYMIEAFGHVADASAAIEELEKNPKWTGEEKKAAEIQNLRGRLFLQQGKVEEAEKWVDEYYKRDKKAAAGPAGMLARALDVMGDDRQKAKKSGEGDELWRKASRFYYISIKPQIDGSMSQRPDEMKEVGNRFFAYGLHFNNVPETRSNFVDWPAGATKIADYFLKAAEVYESALTQTPDYRMQINLGNCYGFLGKWVQSAAVFAKLFDQESILSKDKHKLDPAVTKAKGDLVPAFLQWGVAEQLAFSVDGDKDRLNRAIGIFGAILQSVSPESSKETFWGAKYHVVRAYMDKGLYKDAKAIIDDTQRQVSPTFDDDQFGYKTLFTATIEELKSKLP